MGLDKTPLELNDDFRLALDMIEKQGRNLFITGKAGTGKSTLLQLFRSTTRKKTVVLAPTGVAALNVQGQTIHSFFGFPAKPLDRRDIKKRFNRKLYQNIEVLVIDEISMVRADLLDNIDYFLRVNRESPLPFGGVQVVFFGDLFQLPPVVSSETEMMFLQTRYESPYFFSSAVIRSEIQLEMFELQKVYRQENKYFLKLLDAIRLNRVDEDDLEELNKRYIPGFTSSDYFITLSARNARVDAINLTELARIPLPSATYMARVTGSFNPNLYPAEPSLNLKLNAQVMFTKNDLQRRFVNGTIGKIVKLETETVTVLVEEGEQRRYIETERMDWEVLQYKVHPEDQTRIETEVVGTFNQLPLRLAWAVTIHKSQGKTFDRLIIDLDKGAFENGQTYVALSRCRTLDGIVLRHPLRYQDIMTDERVVEFYERQLYK